MVHESVSERIHGHLEQRVEPFPCLRGDWLARVQVQRSDGFAVEIQGNFFENAFAPSGGGVDAGGLVDETESGMRHHFLQVLAQSVQQRRDVEGRLQRAREPQACRVIDVRVGGHRFAAHCNGRSLRVQRLAVDAEARVAHQVEIGKHHV